MSDLEDIEDEISAIDKKLNSASWRAVIDTKTNNVAILFTDLPTESGELEFAARHALEELEE